MASITGTSGASVPVVRASRSSSPLVRHTFDYEILIDGGRGPVDIRRIGWHTSLVAVTIEERVDGPDVLTLRFLNTGDFILADSSLVAEGARIRIKIGWREVGLVDHGTFYVVQPVQRFGSPNNLEIKAFGGEYLLAKRGERRRAWERNPGGITDSEIATRIAEEYGFNTSEILATTTRYPIVIQTETDWDFLCRRAKLNGYMVYVDQNQLHFHTPKVLPTDGELAFRIAGDSPPNNISAMEVRVNSFRRAPLLKKGQVMLETFKRVAATSADPDDALVTGLNSVMRAKEIVGRVGRSTSFIVGEGHLNDEAEIQRQLDEFSRSAGFAVVEAKCDSIGLEFLRAGLTTRVTMGHLRRFSGQYLIREVSHHFDTAKEGTYRCTILLTRSFLAKVDRTPDLSGGSAEAPSRPLALTASEAQNPVPPLSNRGPVQTGVVGVLG
jgi:hypothetical protein